MEARRALFFVLALISFLLIGSASALLSINFYRNTCPNVESLVRSAVTQKFQQTPVTAQATLRLFFHDCFVRGCDGSVLIASPSNDAEKDHPDDLSLAGDGFDTVIKAKAAVDSVPQCRNKVSCADILALATRDVIFLTGGPHYSVELGRRDGRISLRASVQHSLPQPFFDLDQLNTIFAKHGLSQTNMIALSGAHTLGVSHCSRFSNRIYNFNRTHQIDPTLNFSYAMQLRKSCQIHADPDLAVPIDATSDHTFDNAYFKNLQQGMGLFSSDQVLFTDPRSRPTVKLFASSENTFRKAFVTAITKLGRLGVLTGSQGEIRTDCSRPNEIGEH